MNNNGLGLYKNLKEWIQGEDVQHRLYRTWDKRYTNCAGELNYFHTMMVLPNNDILVGLQPVDSDMYRLDEINYKKLSEIYFEYHEEDQISE